MTIVVGQPVPLALAEANVLDRANEARTLGSTWRARDVVLVFVRHFACIGCAEHIATIRPRIDELAVLGVDAVIVGSGTPDQLAAFIEREDLRRPNVHCFTDHTLESYRAAGLVRSRWGTFGPIALGQAAWAYLHGHRNGKAQGDLHQQGGTLYVTRAGTIALYHRATSLGDHAKLVEVVEIALAARAVEAAAP